MGENKNSQWHKMADPIAALKALVDISKLKSGEDAAAEYLSKIFVTVLYNDPKIALLRASGVGSLVPGPLLEESKKICRDLYTGFMTVCGYPPEIIAILSKIQELTIGKIYKAYKLDGAAFDGITNLLGFKL